MKSTFAINSLIGEGGQGLVLNQFLPEFQRRGLIDKVFCSAKGKYFLDGIPLETVPLSARIPGLLCNLPYIRARKDIITLVSDIIFDRTVSRKINYRDPGVFIGVAGHCLDTIKKIKTKSNKKIILCCMNSHIRGLYRTLEEEDRAFSKGVKTHFVHKGMLERMLEEYELSDKIIVLSKLAFDTFVENGIKEEKLSIIRPGVDLSRFHPDSVKEDNTFRVCFCGLLALGKGFHYLLKAIEESGIPDLECLLYGATGDQVCHRILKDYKKKIKIEQRVGDPVEGYLRSSIFIFPTLEDGWGLVVSEASACGLPVITTESCGAKDMIEEGVNGFIIPSRNVGAIKDKIMLLYNDRRLKDQMSGEALKKRPMLDQNISSRLFFDEYMKLCVY